MPIKEERLMTETQVHEYCGISVKTLQRWRIQGKGPPFIKIYGIVRYDSADLNVYLTENTKNKPKGENENGTDQTGS